ncbi:anaphase-promoting complex, subunit 10-domain-containing protein [Lipomyces japonicus]|uniref:anaphase-promoting complex, subunit 10-domain-containing protein n=1 Tax=Lipomyces japonicus TaxID=56871 RepID=UPI0034CE9D31
MLLMMMIKEEDDDDDDENEIDNDGEEGEEEEEESISEDGDDGIPLRDIGNQATWKLSTWKPGFGLHALLSESTDLYWQSDAPQPHHVDIHFGKRVEIAKILLFLDYTRDESYTPSKIAVFAGSGYHELHQVLVLSLEEPTGWIDISLAAGQANHKFLKTFLVRLTILQNHQTGKDTHVRAIKVMSPDRQSYPIDTDNDHDNIIPFSSIALLSQTTIR